MNYYVWIRRCMILILLTSVIATISLFWAISLSNRVNRLKEQSALRETSWDKQLKFDEAVTSKLLEK